jgi:hypothetical protein
METWKKCGHPRTQENTSDIRAKKPNGNCSTCEHARKNSGG